MHRLGLVLPLLNSSWCGCCFSLCFLACFDCLFCCGLVVLLFVFAVLLLLLLLYGAESRTVAVNGR